MFSSIRSKLIAIFIFLIGLPLLLSGYSAYEAASRAILAQTEEQLGNLALKTAQQIDSFVDGARNEIRLLSDSPFIQLSFLQYEFGQRLDTVRRLLNDYVKEHAQVKSIVLVNLEGVPILSVPAEPPVDGQLPPPGEWFRAVLKKGQYLSDLPVNYDLSNSTLYLAQTVHDFEDRTSPVGVIIFNIRATAFTDFVSSLKLGLGGYGFLMHRDGHVIYHPDARWLNGKEYLESGDTRLEKQISRMMMGEKGFGDYTFDREEKYFVYTPCRTRDWSVCISVLKPELMADVVKLRRQMIAFLAVVIGISVPISYLFIRGITRPVKQLMEGAGAIARGDLDQTINIRSNDELKALAEEFNLMAKQLKTSMGQILELKAFNEDVLRSVSSGIITVDRYCNLTSHNSSAETILGALPEEDGKDRWEDAREVMELLKITLESGAPIQDQELTLVRGNGAKNILGVNTALLRDGADQIVGAIAEIRDITRRKGVEEQMLRIEKLASLGELSAGVAHEIRNPLAGIKTSMQVLAKRRGTDAERMLIDGVLDEINRLNTIVTDLLKFSRPSPPVFVPSDLRVILEKTVDLVWKSMRTCDIELEHLHEEGLPQVMIDREQVQQVFLNLLLNAIKAMKQGGKLALVMKQVCDEAAEPFPGGDEPACFETSSYVQVEFIDTGCGISAEDLPRVFDPFFTSDPSGTGLGLSIAHKLLEENRGTISIESELGKGTRVIIRLPAGGGPSSTSRS
ncbi:PAS domain-containing sensor histidine kinase [Desulfomonile tiedjei]|uniref:histidine kinase n=1 Tax=Desulfomonile tiedjei (strain ATCC 49306 / DSM 6799 / DCB-1) TaxID=706587 RepID=I4C1V2_DESTA|nr:PAS domain-containing sensor histidine kinase [Desulfomonile tiedjei]AFM23543.1 PAS domain S-box [Desulfomonile tiedjei DSM 6799]